MGFISLLARPFRSLFLDRRLLAGGHARWVGLHWLLAMSTIALVGVTWRLWTPQTVFPQVPLLSIGLWIPSWLEWIAASVMIVSPALAAVSVDRESIRRTALAVFIVATLVLFVANGHRLQPWAYQFVLIAAVLMLAPGNRSLGLCRLLTTGVYFHSAWTKFDYSFIHGLGLRLVAPLRLPEPFEIWAATVLPLAEMLIALGLLVTATRTAAVVCAIVMHVILLAVLGPWGLDHSSGVLLWNVFFIVQNIVLFWPSQSAIEHWRWKTVSAFKKSRMGFQSSLAIVALALVLPLAEPWGWWDLWPSWGLYASKAERTAVLLRVSNEKRWPAEFQEYLLEVPDSPGWWQLDLQAWSLDALGVPLYPQNRFQLAVASRVAATISKNLGIRVLLVSPSNRWTGARATEDLSNRPKIDARRAKYLLSAEPAENWLPSTAH